MILSDYISTAGVTMILAAFVLQQRRILTGESTLYLWLNMAGSGLALVGAWMIGSYPFVVLEGVWGLVSLAGLVRKVIR